MKLSQQWNTLARCILQVLTGDLIEDYLEGDWDLRDGLQLIRHDGRLPPLALMKQLCGVVEGEIEKSMEAINQGKEVGFRELYGVREINVPLYISDLGRILYDLRAFVSFVESLDIITACIGATANDSNSLATAVVRLQGTELSSTIMTPGLLSVN